MEIRRPDNSIDKAKSNIFESYNKTVQMDFLFIPFIKLTREINKRL